MTTREKIAQELRMKEERISSWESHAFDRDFCEMPSTEYWYDGEME